MNYFEDISMDISCYIFIGKYLTKIDVIVKFLSSPDANPEIYWGLKNDHQNVPFYNLDGDLF